MADRLTLRVRDIRPSATLAIHELSDALIKEGRKVYRLGLGQSPFPVPPSVVQALRDHAHEKDYLPVRGLPALREAIADHVLRNTGVSYSPGLVQTGPGSKELIFLTQLILDVEVLLPSPSWVSYQPQATLAGRDLTWLTTKRANFWNLRPEVLEAHCASGPKRSRLLILNYPNNPTGATLDGGALTELAAVARAHGVLVISDEIYGLVDHDGTHATLSKYYHEGTIVSTGISKWCGAGGWRLGALLFPQELRWLADAMAAAASETFSSVSAPIQHAATVAYRGGPEIDEYLRHSRRIMRALGRSCASSLDGCGLVVNRPEGGFYLFPSATPLTEGLKARGIETSEALCNRLLADTGVALLPGSVFGRPVDELTFRLSYVDFDGHAALQGSMATNGDLDEAFLRTYCPRVIDAMTAMVEWFPKRDA
jgi:aspartate aminotransferase